MLHTADLLRQYDRQLRTAAEVASFEEYTRLGPLWLAKSPARGRGFITYESLPPGTDLDALVEAAVEHYRSDDRITEAEWKTRGHDHAPGLMDLLVAHGFQVEEQETVMVGQVQAALDAEGPLPPGYAVEQAQTPEEFREAEALAARVFGDDPDAAARRADALVARWQHDPQAIEMWLVRSPEGEVVCSGRIDVVAGTEFAGLWGGACDEAHRGKGLYRAVTAARARSVQPRGVRWLHSDCTDYSRPILERAGLVAVTTTTPAIWRRG